MTKTLKSLLATLAVGAVFSTFAAEDDCGQSGAVGWTPVAIGIASPVQLPWGMARWDVFGLDLNLLYADAPKVDGLIIAAGGTTTRDDLIGMAVSGLFNFAGKDVYGLRATLGMNIGAGTIYGCDLGGFGYHRRICGGDIELVGTMQENADGFLASVIFNLTQNRTYGCTIAGGVNFVPVAYGAQVAGIFNYADELHGCQIGIVNFARECPWGFQIGVINIILDNKVKVLPIVNGYF